MINVTLRDKWHAAGKNRSSSNKEKKTKQKNNKWKSLKYAILTRTVSFVATRCFTQSNAASDDVHARAPLLKFVTFTHLHNVTKAWTEYKFVFGEPLFWQQPVKKPVSWRTSSDSVCSHYIVYVSFVPLLANDRKTFKDCRKSRKNRQVGAHHPVDRTDGLAAKQFEVKTRELLSAGKWNVSNSRDSSMSLFQFKRPLSIY